MQFIFENDDAKGLKGDITDEIMRYMFSFSLLESSSTKTPWRHYDIILI